MEILKVKVEMVDCGAALARNGGVILAQARHIISINAPIIKF